MKKLLLAVVALVFAFSANAQLVTDYWMPYTIDWGQESVGISTISAVDHNIVWVTGYDGSGGGAYMTKVGKTTDGGQSWSVSTVLAGTGYGLGNIWGVSEDIAYVALFHATLGGDNNTGIYRTLDGGATWEKVGTVLQGAAPGVFANNVVMFDELNGMCHGDVDASNKFIIFYTNDGGANWTQVSGLPTVATGETGGYTSVIDAIGTTVVFGTNKGNVYISDDMGVTWTTSVVGLSDCNGVAVRDADNIIAWETGTDGVPTAYVTEDGGASWEEIVPSTSSMYGAGTTYIPGTDGWWVSVGANQALSGASYSEDNGADWNDITYMVDGNAIQMTEVDFYAVNRGFTGNFDAIIVYDATVDDVTAPVADAEVIYSDDLTMFVISFNEAVNETAKDVANYVFENASKAGTVLEAMISPTDPSMVGILVEGLTAGSNYVFTVSNVEDLAGNAMTATAYNIGTGIDNPSFEYSMYPNPVVDNLMINNISNVERIVVTNMLGQEVATYNNINQNVQIEMSNLESGIYFINFFSNNSVATEKVVKQ